MPVFLSIFLFLNASLLAGGYSHSVETTPEMRLQLAIKAIQDAIERPNEANLATLESILDPSESAEAMASLRTITVNKQREATSLSSSSDLAVVRAAVVSTGEDDGLLTADIRLTADIAIDVLSDSFHITLVPSGMTWYVKGLANGAVVTRRLASTAEKALAASKDDRRVDERSSTEITDYTSPNLLKPSIMSHNVSILNSTTSNAKFGGDVLSRPYGVCGFKYDDPVASLDHDLLFCVDANWDRLLYSGTPTNGGNEWIKTGLSHGSGSYNVNCPMGVDFAAFNLVIADAYNHRAVMYRIDPSDGHLVFQGTFANNNGVVADVAAAWLLNRQTNQSQWGEVALLDQTNRRVDLFNINGTFERSLNLSTYTLNNPTSICYGRHLLDNFNAGDIYIADNGNHRVLRSATNQYYVVSTPPGTFPSNAYLTSVDCDTYGTTVFVTDSYNGKLYALTSDLQSVIAIYGTKGTAANQLWYPTAVNQAIGWHATGLSGQPATPIQMGDIVIGEAWGTSTGVKKFVRGFDVLGTDFVYHKGGSIGWGDYIEFSWFQTGPTSAAVKFYNDYANFYFDESPYKTETLPLTSDGWVHRRVDFDKTVGESFLCDTFWVRVILTAKFNSSLKDTLTATIPFCRTFYTSSLDTTRFVVSDTGVSDIETSLKVDRVYGGTRYLLFANVRDTKYDTTKIWYYWTGVNTTAHAKFKDNLNSSYTTPLITLSDSVWVYFDHVPNIDGSNQKIDCYFGWRAHDTGVFKNYPKSTSYPGTGDDPISPPTAAWAMTWINRPYYCVPSGFTCPSNTPPACPFLYAWTGENYQFVNNVLPQAEVFPSTFQTDWQMLPVETTEDSGQIHIQLSEEERELSTFDYLGLFAVDLPESLADIRLTNLHELALPHDSEIVPVSAVTNLETDVLNDLIAADNQVFVASDSGWIDIEYDLGQMATSKDDFDTKSQGSSPGGGHVPPPPKNMTKWNITNDSLDPDIYFILVDTGTGEYFEVTRIAPRVSESNELVRLSDYVRNHSLKLRLAWNHRATIDYLPYVNYDVQNVTVTPLSLASAIHSTTGSITSAVNSEDSTTATLSPWEAIELRFDAGTPPAQGHVRRYVFEAVGTYMRIPWEENPPEDSTNGNNGFSFEQSYPNPANPSTTFKFSLPVTGHVELQLFNILGQKVATIVDEIHQAGTYTATWDGRVTGGRIASTGVYFAKLTAGTYTATKKVVIVK